MKYFDFCMLVNNLHFLKSHFEFLSIFATFKNEVSKILISPNSRSTGYSYTCKLRLTGEDWSKDKELLYIIVALKSFRTYATLNLSNNNNNNNTIILIAV